MKRVFVDANVFLRLLTHDDEDQHDHAFNLFSSANAGKLELVVGVPVLFEVVWTLRSHYRYKSDAVLEILESILETKGLTVLDSPLVERAIHKARTSGIDFSDAYIAVQCEVHDCTEIATFNVKHFKRLGMPTMNWGNPY